MITLLIISTKIIVYAVGSLLFMAFLGFKYLRLSSDISKVEKRAGFLNENPIEAKNLAMQLNSKLYESDTNTELIFSKLSSLKYQKDFGSHTVYLCKELNRTSFLLITVYEYLDTNRENSTEVIFKLNYKVILNYVDNTLQFYSDESTNETINNLKKDFIKRFLSNQCGIEVQ